MKTKIISIFLILAASVGTMFAGDYNRVQSGDLYYQRLPVGIVHQMDLLLSLPL